MAPESGVIASAVILPETEATPPSKRRQSSISDTISKRPKLSHDASDRSPTSVRPSSPRSDEVKQDPSDQRRGSIQDRRKSSMQEEKKRSQRLFGGLLTTLSQSTPNGQQKRRQEVEKRQQEKAKQQKAADEKRRRETLTTLKTVREAEQIKFNQEAMQTRHTNVLAKAHFLSTKSHPKLYYKPWELLPEQEDRIKKQIAEAEATIDRETVSFYDRYPTARNPTQAPVMKTKEEETNTTSEETMGEPQVEPESPPVSNIVNVDTTNSIVQAQVAQSEQLKTVAKQDLAHDQDEHEHNGEVVLENEEDTVIY